MPQLAGADVLVTVQRDEVARGQQVGPTSAVPPVLERHLAGHVLWRTGNIVAGRKPQLEQLVAYARIVHAKLRERAQLNALRLHALYVVGESVWFESREIEPRGPQAHVCHEATSLQEADPTDHVFAAPFVDLQRIQRLQLAHHQLIQLAADSTAEICRIDHDCELELAGMVMVVDLRIVAEADDP